MTWIVGITRLLAGGRVENFSLTVLFAQVQADGNDNPIPETDPNLGYVARIRHKPSQPFFQQFPFQQNKGFEFRVAGNRT